MNYCKNCGTVIPSGQTSCPNCGSPVNFVSMDTLGKVGNELKTTVQTALESCDDYTWEYDQFDIAQGRNMSLLSYFSWLCLVPILKGMTPYTKFHANQGLILAIASTALGLVGELLKLLFGKIFMVGLLVRILCWAIRALTAGFSIIGILNALNGKAKELPVIGKIKLLK